MNSLQIVKAKIAVKMVFAGAALIFSPTSQAASFDYYLLAASWQPGFCISHADKPECKNLVGTYAATNLDLHGLWPNDYDGSHPFYCGVPQSQINLDSPATWCSMASYGVSSTTMNNLAMYMPGVQSCLDKHEWYKHGSCANLTPDTYWNTANGMIARLNTTSFSNFIRSNIGKYVSRTQLLTAFNNSQGANSSSALALQCKKTNNISYLTEVWINVQQSKLASFPAYTSLTLDGTIAGTCPSSNIFIAAAK